MKLLHDVIFLAGVAIQGYGLWLYWDALAYMVVGTELMVLGLYAARPTVQSS